MGRLPIKLAVLVSGGGTTLQNLIDRIADRTLNARIEAVIASRPNIRAIERAQAANLTGHLVERKTFASPEAFADRVFDHIDDAGVDLICMGGWLSFCPIPPRYESRVINIHPSLLPAFGGHGMYGLRVHQAVLDAHATESGCTVHFVDNVYDNGPIILQRPCPVRPDDTVESLAQRVASEEAIAFPEAIKLFAEGRIFVTQGRVVVR